MSKNGKWFEPRSHIISRLGMVVQVNVILRRTVCDDDIVWRCDNLLSGRVDSRSVVKTSVNVITNSPSQDYIHPNDHGLLTYNNSNIRL